jgi:hypothetical protein
MGPTHATADQPAHLDVHRNAWRDQGRNHWEQRAARTARRSPRAGPQRRVPAREPKERRGGVRRGVGMREEGWPRVRGSATGMRGAALGRASAHLGRVDRAKRSKIAPRRRRPVAKGVEEGVEGVEVELAPRDPLEAVLHGPPRGVRRRREAHVDALPAPVPDVGAQLLPARGAELPVICQVRVAELTDRLRTACTVNTRARAGIGRGCWVGLRASRCGEWRRPARCASEDTMSYPPPRRA